MEIICFVWKIIMPVWKIICFVWTKDSLVNTKIRKKVFFFQTSLVWHTFSPPPTPFNKNIAPPLFHFRKKCTGVQGPLQPVDVGPRPGGRFDKFGILSDWRALRGPRAKRSSKTLREDVLDAVWHIACPYEPTTQAASGQLGREWSSTLPVHNHQVGKKCKIFFFLPSGVWRRNPDPRRIDGTTKCLRPRWTPQTVYHP